MNFSLSIFFEGLTLGLVLIIAIGAQNIFVLKQAILKNYVFLMAITCSLIDTTLIILGINGVGHIFTSSPLFIEISRWGGALFLFCYGFRSFKSALKKRKTLTIDAAPKALSLKKVIFTLLAVSILNPHTYIDTCVLMGSISTKFSSSERPSFTMGAILASFIWFFSLGYGAKFLKPIFAKPIAWRILDFLIGCIMFSIALSFLFIIEI